MTIDHQASASTAAIEDLEFLVRSPYRIRLLTELSQNPQSRQDLQDKTSISQPTLGRILADFEERQWVTNHHNGEYTLTQIGILLASTLEEMLSVIETANQLSDIHECLPPELLQFGLHYLSTATVTTPTVTAPLAHMRRFDELVSTADHVKMFTNVLSCSPSHEATAADREFFANVDELVVTSDAVRSDMDYSTLIDWLFTRVEEDELDLYRYDDSADFLFGICDKTVGIELVDDSGMPCGLIETTAEPIYTWISERFEDHRQRSTRLTPEEFSNIRSPNG